MLANKNKGALNRIKQNEKVGYRMLPLLVFAMILMSSSIVLRGGFGMIWILMLIPIGAFLWHWGNYLCRFLDKIDMSRMSVTEVSKYILKYKIYLIRHTIIAAVFLPVYLGVWAYHFYIVQHPDVLPGTDLKIALALYLLSALVLFFIIIWFRFFRHIRTIQKNLKELEEFTDEE